MGDALQHHHLVASKLVLRRLAIDKLGVALVHQCFHAKVDRTEGRVKLLGYPALKGVDRFSREQRPSGIKALAFVKISSLTMRSAHKA